MKQINVPVSLTRYMVNEAVSNANFSKAIDLIKSYLRKNNIFTRTEAINVDVEGTRYYGCFTYSCKTFNGAYFLWHQGGSTELDAVLFTSDAAKNLNIMLNGGSMNFDVDCEVRGTSLAKLLPLVADIINKKVKMNPDQIRKWFDDNALYESLEEDMVSEAQDDLAEVRKRINYLKSKIKAWEQRGKDTSEMQEEIKTLEAKRNNLMVNVRTNVNVSVEGDINEIAPQEEEFEERATPEERFADMEHYINMVIKGLQPSVLICGAPGVGKTYRVMKKIKASGLNYLVIKGKETAGAFYQDLFFYRHEDDIIICDDADDVLTDDTITNLIKAATDSSDERIVSYGTSRPPIISADMFEQLPPEDQVLCGEIEARGAVIHTFPKSFEFMGKMIIITNRNAGQIDTAVRNRGLICDLQFTVEECLGLIRDIMPAIMPGKLSAGAKYKALKYLQELAEAKSKMEISIRSFTTVAKVYEDVDDEGQAERMIKEQMKLQSLRGGKKY